VIERLIILKRIGPWSVDQQKIMNSKRELLPCLGKSYIAFNNALRLNLKALRIEHNIHLTLDAVIFMFRRYENLS